MRRLAPLALAVALLMPSSSRSEEPLGVIAPEPYLVRGPQLPTAAEESRDVVRLASAVAPGTLTPEPPHPVTQATATAPTEAQRQLAEKLAEYERLRVEIEQLRKSTKTPEQLLFKVELLEVSLSKLKSMGIDSLIVNSDEAVDPEVIAKLRIPAAYNPSNAPTAPAIPADGSLAELVALLKAHNIAKTVADPTLVTTTGRPASLLIGGQIPIPAPPASQSPVELRDFGTKVDLTPTALGNDIVRLDVAFSVSEIDNSMKTVVQGQFVPVISGSAFQSTITATIGQTMLLSGLKNVREESVKRWNGKVETQRHEFETWCLVRAEAIEPMDPQLR